MWRNRGEVLQGHGEIIEFLRRKWERELDYALRKELWTYCDDRIAVCWAMRVSPGTTALAPGLPAAR